MSKIIRSINGINYEVELDYYEKLNIYYEMERKNYKEDLEQVLKDSNYDFTESEKEVAIDLFLDKISEDDTWIYVMQNVIDEIIDKRNYK